MKSWWLAAIGMAAVSLFPGCGSGSKVAGTCSSGFAVQFRITSVKDSLPLDSLSVEIAVGSGSPQAFAVNLKTGVSSAAIKAKQGQDYKLTFKLYSAGFEIGNGESQGHLECDLDVALDPKWISEATEKAKKQLEQGVLLPEKLETYFAQAVAGRDFELPLDSLTGNNVYRWYLKLDGKTLIENSGPVVRIPIADSLAGKSVTLRLQVLAGNTIKEDRTWIISVLAAPPADRLARILTRSDTTVQEGISSAFTYESDGKRRLVEIAFYNSLVPKADEKPVARESLHYDDKGRIDRTVKWLPDSARTDSVFAYDADGRLAALDVREGAESVADSFSYEEGKLSGSRRYVNGALTGIVKFKWMENGKREDSVFTQGDKGATWTRLIRNVFKNDSLVSRLVLEVRDGLQPKSREVIAYNALGGRAYREAYLEGSIPTLEETETYRYDSKGRLASSLLVDEVAGLLISENAYQYAAAGGKVSANSAGASAPGRTALQAYAVLSDIRFAHTLSGLSRPARARLSGMMR